MIPWRRKWQSTPVLWPGEFHGQRSRPSYSPWDRRVRQDCDVHFPQSWCWVRSLLYCDLSDFFHSLSDEFKKLGIQCFYQNTSLVGWANVVFLCCLPSQLPNICVEIQTRLGKDCIVYSFVSAIPVSRYLVGVSTGLAGPLCHLMSTPAPPLGVGHSPW